MFLITLQKRTWKKPNIHFQPGNSEYYRAVESLAFKHPILQVHNYVPQGSISTTETMEEEFERMTCIVFITTLFHFTKRLVKLKFQQYYSEMAWDGGFSSLAQRSSSTHRPGIVRSTEAY